MDIRSENKRTDAMLSKQGGKEGSHDMRHSHEETKYKVHSPSFRRSSLLPSTPFS